MATAEALLKRFNTVKTLPHVSIRLSKLISDENSDIHDFEKLIRMDPTLVFRLLRLVNSPYYGLQQKVDSISRAVVFIGMKNLRNMVVTEALKDIFKNTPEEEIFPRKRLWLHCVATSICCQMIAERIFGQKGENAFLCGILHDIGLIIEDQVSHDLWIQAFKAYEPKVQPITAYEKETVGTDHSAVGYLLAHEWNLPPDVQDGIRSHHKTLNDVSPSSISGIIQTAEYIVTNLSYDVLQGMDGGLSPQFAVFIRENVNEYQAVAKDLPDEMSKAKDIYESSEE